MQFMVAGHATSADAITWCVYILATRPDIQDKLRTEINHMLERAPHPTYNDINSCTYLENVIKEAEHSKKMLKHDVDVFYIHAPDQDTPMEQTLEGVNEVYKKGFFKRFGLSNYKAEDVEKVYNHCKEKGYPLPSVYQGMRQHAKASFA